MQVVILAGGLATRMQKRFSDVPKILIPVAGRTFMDLQLTNLARRGAERVLLCVGHLGDQVRAHVARHPPPLPITIIEDGPRLAGTGGALRAALDAGLLEDQFILGFGDSYLSAELAPVMAKHRAANRPVTMTVFRNEDWLGPSNCVVTDDRVTWYGKPKLLAERPARTQWIDYGLTAFEREFIASWKYEEPFDLALALSEAARSGRVSAYEVFDRFYEIGSEDGLRALEEAIRSNAPRITRAASD